MNLNYDMWRNLMLMNSNKKTSPKMYGMYLNAKKHKKNKKKR